MVYSNIDLGTLGVGVTFKKIMNVLKNKNTLEENKMTQVEKNILESKKRRSQGIYLWKNKNNVDLHG